MADLDTIAEGLYGLLPQDFTRVRNERAQQLRGEGDKDLADQVRRLPRPSTAAWVTNMLARHRGHELEQVLQLGEQLRRAQADLDGAQLRTLSRQRRELTAAVTVHARRLGEELGHRVSASVAAQVEETLRAAMSDADAAVAVRGGRLTEALSASGLPSADSLEGLAAGPTPEAPARPTSPGKRRDAGGDRDRAEQQRRDREQAEQRLARATRAAEQAAEEREQAARAVQDAVSRVQEVEEQLEALRQQVARAEQDLAGAQERVRVAERQQQETQRSDEDARRTADRARQRLDRLT